MKRTGRQLASGFRINGTADRVWISLPVQPDIGAEVGADKAPILLNALRRAVMGRKHEIEAGSGSVSREQLAHDAEVDRAT
jgi:hypothetical protein